MILGLDIGTKRVGVALTEGTQAYEYTTLDNTNDLNNRVAEICRSEGVEMLVVGLPVEEDGSITPQAEYTMHLADELASYCAIPVVYENEILTTFEAKRILTEMGLAGAELEDRLDQFAACLILQQYLNKKAPVNV